MKPLIELVEEIRHGIPSSYHTILEKRLAIAWGKKPPKAPPGQKSRPEIISTSRDNRARNFYLRALDENCHMLLPFILAHSPRACLGFNIGEVARLQDYGQVQVEKDKRAETKELIEDMARRGGFSQHPQYLKFIGTIFPQESEKPEAVGEEVDLNARNNSAFPPTGSANCVNPPPPNESSIAGVVPEVGLRYHDGDHRVFEKASLQGIAEVFNERMCEAIRKDTVLINGATYTNAAVTMDFPLLGLVDCLMSLAIDESKVEYLAMALFNVQVGSIGNVRQLTLPGGVSLTPNPEVTLKGVLDEAVISEFGPQIHNAVATSGIGKKELPGGVRMTEGISMILSRNSHEGAIINLSLSVKGGVQIRTKIYP